GPKNGSDNCKIKHASSQRTLWERSFQPTQDAVGFTHAELHDPIGSGLRAAVGIDAQRRRVARRPEMRHIAVTKINAHAVQDIDAGNVVESKRGCEKPRSEEHTSEL